MNPEYFDPDTYDIYVDVGYFGLHSFPVHVFRVLQTSETTRPRGNSQLTDVLTIMLYALIGGRIPEATVKF